MFFGFLKKKPQYPATERRCESRYDAEDEFVIEFQGGHSRYIGTSRDISLHGVRFVTTCKLAVKKKVTLNFRFPEGFPGQKRVSVQATVVRIYKPRGTERYRVGCRLQHTSEATEEPFRQFIYWMEQKK